MFWINWSLCTKAWVSHAIGVMALGGRGDEEGRRGNKGWEERRRGSFEPEIRTPECHAKTGENERHIRDVKAWWWGVNQKERQICVWRTINKSINKLIQYLTILKLGVSFIKWRMLVGLQVITVRKVEIKCFVLPSKRAAIYSPVPLLHGTDTFSTFPIESQTVG